MAWILICGTAVLLSSDAALVLGKSPLASHPLWGRVLWGLITLPTVGLILYGLGIRPIYLMVRKASSGATGWMPWAPTVWNWECFCFSWFPRIYGDRV
jgi:hypothetical protein